MNPVWKLNFFLFNIEGYGKFFSGITPFRQKTLILMVPHSNWLWTVTTDPVWHFQPKCYKIQRCHVTASIWILCNILENIPHALDVHAQRVLKYNFILICDFTIIETGRFNVFL